LTISYTTEGIDKKFLPKQFNAPHLPGVSPPLKEAHNKTAVSLLKASHSSFISRLINATVDYNLRAIFIQIGSTALVNHKICFWNYSVQALNGSSS